MDQTFKNELILICGIPATGKSSFCRYLNREHGFVHYNLECYPQGWPIPELHPIWESSRSKFVYYLRQHHSRVALDWGFPPHCFSWVLELQEAGVTPIWFDGDVTRARQIFIKQGGIDISNFDRQIKEIKEAGLPRAFQNKVIDVFN